VQRSQLILAMLDGANNAVAARQFDLHLDTPRLWRKRWLQLSPQLELLERSLPEDEEATLRSRLELLLSDQPRPGTPPQFSPEQVTAIIALACEDPRTSGYSFEHWTPSDLAREAIKRGIVISISPASISRFLKRGGDQAPS
jgi:putative transposase